MLQPARHDRNRGQACAEFALLLPILVLLLFGIYDFACAIRAQNSITNMSREGANLVSRPSAGMQNRLHDIMNVLALTAQPLNMRSDGMMYITVVKGGTIQSQAGWQGSELQETVVSRVGTPSRSDPNPRAQGLDSLALGAEQTAYVVEVFYYYRSLFSSNALMLGEQMYSRSVF